MNKKNKKTKAIGKKLVGVYGSIRPLGDNKMDCMHVFKYRWEWVNYGDKYEFMLARECVKCEREDLVDVEGFYTSVMKEDLLFNKTREVYDEAKTSLNKEIEAFAKFVFNCMDRFEGKTGKE